MEIRFHRRLYSLAALRESLEAYAGVAEGTVERDGDSYFRVTFSRVDEEVAEILPNEFANYALYRTVIGRQA